MTHPDATRFATLTGEILDAWYAAHPQYANRLGLRQYAGQVADWSEAAIQTRLSALQRFADQLAQINPRHLDQDAQMDYDLLRGAIQKERWEWETLRHWQTNPAAYSNLLDVSEYIKRDYAPLPERVAALIAHLDRFPAIVHTAQTNLAGPLPKPFVETALDAVGEGMLSFLKNDLTAALAPLREATLRARFEKTQMKAIAAVAEFHRWLREEKALQATEDGFAIGESAFAAMLRWGEMVDLPLTTVLAAGEAELARLEEAAHRLAAQIQPGASPQAVMQTLTKEHPSKEQLVPETAATLEALRQYTLDHRIVSIPSEVRCRVEATPAFLRWAFAMMDVPGPLEDKATEAYYFVTPPREDWSPEEQDAWLTKFDRYTMFSVSAHEAYPGHYVQLLHHRRAPTLISKVFDSYSFLEGWAHYVEEMMLDEGYGDGDPKLRLAQVSEALLRACRHIVAIKMHTEGMTVPEATRFFMQHAYMAELPSYKEAVRGTFDPGYLNYTVGKLMVKKLRADYEREQGSRFSLQRFHDELLARGSPPLPLVRRRMLKSPDSAIL